MTIIYFVYTFLRCVYDTQSFAVSEYYEKKKKNTTSRNYRYSTPNNKGENVKRFETC